MCSLGVRGAPKKGGGGAAGLQTPNQVDILKNTHFGEGMILKLLRNLPFSRNQPPNSAGD
jgi:hypothetical protein